MIEYVTWVLKEARSDGIKRLYFLARDGWIMYELAKVLAPKLNVDIDLKYIHVSRYVLRNAEYYIIGKRCIDSICIGGIDITFEKLMKRAAMTDAEIKAVASEVGYTNRLDECLSYSQIQELKNKLDSLGISFFEFVNTHSKAFYDSTSAYFESVGLTESVNYAIVDSGWLGSTARSMENILENITGEKKNILGYYFGIYNLPVNASASNYKSFYLRPRFDIGKKARFSICLFETLFSSYEGMTMGYRKMADKIVPDLSKNGNPNSKEMLRNKDLIMLYESNLKAGDLSIRNVKRLLSLIMSSPTKDEARILGSLQFCDDVLELQMQNVAARWDMHELKKQNVFRKIKLKLLSHGEKLHESGWPEASIVNLVGDGFRGKWALFSERLFKRGIYVRKAIEEKN